MNHDLRDAIWLNIYIIVWSILAITLFTLALALQYMIPSLFDSPASGHPY
jgi:hypothetical protein